MMKLRKFLALSLVSVMMLSLVACGSSTPTPAPAAPVATVDSTPATPVPAAPEKPHRVVFTMFNGLNPVAREIEAGFVSEAEKLGINLWVMDNELDPIKMNANVDMAIAAGDVDFYVLYTNDIASNPQLMDKLTAAGIPVLTIATAAIAADGTEASLFFSNDDNYDSAYLAAEALAQSAVDKGWTEEECVFVSMGFLEAGGVFLTRTQGAIDGVRSVFPNVEYVETSSTGSTEVAFQRTADILMTLPNDKKLIGWTHSDDVTASMLAALRGADRVEDGLLVSNGLSMQMLDMLKDPDGIIIGSIDMNWALFGPAILSHVIELLDNGTEIPKVINAPYELLLPENVDVKYPQQ